MIDITWLLLILTCVGLFFAILMLVAGAFWFGSYGARRPGRYALGRR